MSIQRALQEKVLERFDDLIAEGEALHAATTVTRHARHNNITGSIWGVSEHHHMDLPRFVKWRTNAKTLLTHVVPAQHPHRAEVERFSVLVVRKDSLEYGVALLKAIKEDCEKGFLGELAAIMRADLAGDYLAQAEVLYAEGYYVPAAVLAGAVLEDALRKLCDEKGVATTKPSGERRGINATNDDLAKAGVYSAAKAHEIRAWADIRNNCAHGDGHKVRPEDVDRMIKGIRALAADYLR